MCPATLTSFVNIDFYEDTVQQTQGDNPCVTACSDDPWCVCITNYIYHELQIGLVFAHQHISQSQSSVKVYL